MIEDGKFQSSIEIGAKTLIDDGFQIIRCEDYGMNKVASLQKNEFTFNIVYERGDVSIWFQPTDSKKGLYVAPTLNYLFKEYGKFKSTSLKEDIALNQKISNVVSILHNNLDIILHFYGNFTNESYKDYERWLLIEVRKQHPEYFKD